jgi:hypothetical protein
VTTSAERLASNNGACIESLAKAEKASDFFNQAASIALGPVISIMLGSFGILALRAAAAEPSED